MHQYNMFTSFLLQLNALDVVSEREAQWYNMYLPFRHHTGVPETGLYCYSWAEKPEHLEPSGTANFSKFHATIRCVLNGISNPPILFRAYAINYNILEIKDGQGYVRYQQ